MNPQAFVRVFIADDAVISYAEVMVLASLLTGPIYGLYQLCQVFLQSTGKAKYATIVSLMDKGIIYIPALVIMNILFGMYGIVFAGCVSLFIALITGMILSFKWNQEIRIDSDVVTA